MLSARPDGAPQWPGLDGLRGLAVLAVLVYHHDSSWLPGGYLGVSLFFTLSGFLITTLLLREHTATGSIGLGAFWARRARRLLPVSLLGLGLALVVAATTGPQGELASVAGDVRSALLNVANWRFAWTEVTYGDTLVPPSPVTHYWSLAIEEQVYLVYPLIALLALRWRARGLAITVGVIAMASFARQLSLHDLNRAYLGTDTRALELAVGALLAIWWASGRRVRSPWAVDAVGLAAAGALGVAWSTVDLGTPGLWRGGMLGLAVLGAVVILAAVSGSSFGRALGVRPLAALGTISYGVYVLHFPLFLLLSRERTGLDGPGLLVVRCGAVLLAAAAVHWAVEQPVRRGGALPGWQAPVGLATGLALVLVVALALPETVSGGASESASGLPLVVTMDRPDPGPTTPALPSAAPAPVPTSPDDGASAPAPAPAAPAPAAPEPSGPPPARLLLVGDSLAKYTGAGMQAWADGSGRAYVDVIADGGCTLMFEGLLRVREGWVRDVNPLCPPLIDTAVDVATERPYDAVILMIGSLQLADWQLPQWTDWRGIGDPILDARYQVALAGALTKLTALGVPVLVADVPVPDWRPEDMGLPWPGSGPVTINNSQRTARLNELTAAVVARFPAAQLVPYAATLAGPDGEIDDDVRFDGMHMDVPAVIELMDGGYDAVLDRSYDAVTVRVPVARPRLSL
jgi:peptidoglycan/LPS O-acetylase OafA/YrhL